MRSNIINQALTLASRHIQALALQVDDHAIWDRGFAVLLLAGHALGFVLVARLTVQAAWLLALLLLLLVPLVNLRAGRGPMVESLAPMILAYTVALARVLVAARNAGSGGSRVPEPWAGLLDLGVAMVVAVTWTLLAQAGHILRTVRPGASISTGLGAVIAVLTSVWAAITYLGLRTHGVTASDPFGYVQMAVDLASTASPLHRVALAPLVSDLGIPLWALVPVGYAAPNPQDGLTASAWPPGYSALLAVAILLAGERALYVVTPLFGLLALLTIWALTQEVTCAWPATRRRLAAGVAVAVLATSFQQVDRLVTPMADVPAQVLTAFAFLSVLRSVRRDSLLWAAIAGVSLGAAFAVRYTQVLLCVSLLGIWFAGSRSWLDARRSLLAAVVAGVGAWLTAAPVLWFHWQAFGHPFLTGSAELELFSWSGVPDNAAALLRDLLSPQEFLWLAPFLLVGIVTTWRLSRPAAIGILLWVVVIVGFHVPYAAVRLRDILSVFPALAVLAGVGVLGLLDMRAVSPGVTRAAALAGVLLLVWLRTAPTLRDTAPGVSYTAFGYLRAEQRAAFDTLADVTPPEAVIAASLNSGPIGLYAKRDAVRPGVWDQPSDWNRFLTRMHELRRPVFLLADGDELRGTMEMTARICALTPVAVLPLPYFSPDAGSEDRHVTLFEVQLSETRGLRERPSEGAQVSGSPVNGQREAQCLARSSCRPLAIVKSIVSSWSSDREQMVGHFGAPINR